jgi:DUF1680 family protein
VHHYAPGTGAYAVAGQTVRLVQETAYPWDEKVVITVQPAKAAAWTLAVRIPGWCRGAKLRVNGKAVALAPLTKKGYARVKRVWQAGDRVELVLPMPVERIEAHPAVRQDCGCVALQRGPVVYCLEQVDNSAGLTDLLLPANPQFTVQPGRAGILKGIPLIYGRATRRDAAAWKGALYRPRGSRTKACRITAIPYFMWANRTPGEMLVWLRQAEKGA